VREELDLIHPPPAPEEGAVAVEDTDL
jgi:hypothetical protein